MQVWTAHVHTKRLLFAAIAQQRNGEVQMADDECGNALACLQVQQPLPHFALPFPCHPSLCCPLPSLALLCPVLPCPALPTPALPCPPLSSLLPCPPILCPALSSPLLPCPPPLTFLFSALPSPALICHGP